MHRVLNIKHRVVRRIEPGKAPLATFDTVDLGDEDSNFSINNKRQQQQGIQALDLITRPIFNSSLVKKNAASSVKSEIIGGNNSKKPLSQAAGEDKDKKNGEGGNKDDENAKESGQNKKALEADAPQLASSDEQARSQESQGQTGDNVAAADVPPPSASSTASVNRDSGHVQTAPYSSSCSSSPHLPKSSAAVDIQKGGNSTSSSPAGLSRQGTLGRVKIPIKKQDSESSSSSESCNETHFTFTATRPSIAHLDSADAGDSASDFFSERRGCRGWSGDPQSNLSPRYVDPSQILSPSKRKAYEKRLERLKVTTSPIARPRSTAPISVVTLDEYANISSPEASPNTPSILQDKLKITLPSDEFVVRPKTPKAQHPRSRRDSEEVSFEFSEEILFRRTKSALVVNEDGHAPLSPRRVLIPPTITPATSPQLSPAHRLASSLFQEECEHASSTNTATITPTPKLVFIQNEKTSAKQFFGATVDESENDNWADFPDSSDVNIEKADSERSEKEDLKNAAKDPNISDREDQKDTGIDQKDVDSFVLPDSTPIPPVDATAATSHVVSDTLDDSAASDNSDSYCKQESHFHSESPLASQAIVSSNLCEINPFVETNPAPSTVDECQDDGVDFNKEHVILLESSPTIRATESNTCCVPQDQGSILDTEYSVSKPIASDRDVTSLETDEVLMVEIVKSGSHSDSPTIGIGVKSNDLEKTEPVHLSSSYHDAPLENATITTTTQHSSENNGDCLLELTHLDPENNQELSFPSTEPAAFHQETEGHHSPASHQEHTSLLDAPFFLDSPVPDQESGGAVLQLSVALQPEIAPLAPKSTTATAATTAGSDDAQTSLQQPASADLLLEFVSSSSQPADSVPLSFEGECLDQLDEQDISNAVALE